MTDHFEKADKIAWVQGLLVGCPMGQEEDTCPAKELRTTPLAERMKLVNKMSDEEIESIIQHHRECLHRREG